MLFLLAFCFCTEAAAQQYRAFAHRYGIEEGLPHRQVNGILQDRRNFIWAATNGGVARFDGRKFKVFNQLEDGLGGDRVTWLAEDAGGNIWAGCEGSDRWVSIINPVSDVVTSFQRFFKDQAGSVAVGNWMQAPQPLADGTLLIWDSEANGFFTYHPENGWRFRRIENIRDSKLVRITSRQTIWCVYQDVRSTQYVLAELALDGREIRKYPAHPGGDFGLLKGTAADPDGFFIFATGKTSARERWEIDGQGRRTVSAPRYPQMASFQYAKVDKGEVIVEFPFIYHRTGDLLLDLSQEFPDLDPWQYSDFLIDRSGNIWFATKFGLVLVELRKNYFQRLLHDEHASGGRGLACRGMLELNGQLFVNTESNFSGRFLTDLNTGVTQRLPGAETALAIAPGADGNIWTEWRLKENEEQHWGTVLLQKITPQGVPTGPQYRMINPEGGFIWSIFEEKADRVLLGLAKGLMVLNPLTGEAARLSNARFPEVEHAPFYFIKRDRAGRIWVCSSQGVYLFHNGGITDRFWPGGQGDHYLPYENILHLYEDAEGIFWLATAGGGLIRWDRKAAAGRQTQVIFRKNGLLNGVVYATYEDRHGHLWLPTDIGIAQLDKKALHVRRTWVKADGITHNEFNRISHCQGTDGSLYFGGLNGVTAFQPDNFYKSGLQQKEPALLVASAFQVLYGNSGQLENRLPELLASHTFTMYPDHRYLQLEFALLEYIASDRATYFWQIDGVTEDWELLNEPVLRLSGLPYGRHKLILRAQASNGVWAKNDLQYTLIIPPPVYLRGWFISLVIAFMAIGIWSWLSWRIRRHREEQERLEQEVERQTATIRLQTEELEQLDQLKSRFFANVSHELRTPLTLLRGPIEYALNDTGLGKQSRTLLYAAQRNTVHLQNLVNEILDLSKLRATGLDLKQEPTVLYDFVEETLSPFQSQAQNKAIALQLDYRPEPSWTLALDRQKLFKIIGNLLSNALKYAPNGSAVVVQVEQLPGNFVLRVRDEGPGIHPDDLPHIFELYYQSKRPESKAEGGTGIGLALARELAQAMGGSLWAESTPGSGSTFSLTLPAQERSPENAAPTARSGQYPVNFDLPEVSPASAAPTEHVVAARLLVVEDNPDLQTFLRAILPLEYHLTVVDNGRAALEHLTVAERMPDLILSDLMMPEMDGFELLEALRNSDSWRPIPLILLTALAGSDDRLRAFRVGIDDYITKPFSAEELIVRIENALRNQAARREWMESLPEEVSEPGESAADDWLLLLRETARQNLGNPQFNIDDLAERMGISRKTLYRQIRIRAGLSANQFIQELRLLQARELIDSGQYQTLRQVAEAVGLRSGDYLSRLYRERFGKSPATGL
ncbi:MAG TPA: ATP-binding protein [Saprospiraceae bacterium]|nr:ATP-binding protein [Saprospiraceae bacterium]